MRFECDRKDFADALRIVGRVNTGKQGGVFQGIHIKAKLETAMPLEVQATNGEMSIATTLPASCVEECGEVHTPKGFLPEIIGRMGGHELEFRHNETEGVAHIRSGAAKFSIRTQNVAGYPETPRVTDAGGFGIKQSIFSDMARKTAFACSKDDTRPVFTGCHFHIKDGTATMEATNTHRLAVKTCEVSGLADMQGIIIPVTAVQEAARILKDTEAGTDPYVFRVKGRSGNNMIGFDFGYTRMTSRLIAGQFPDIERVIPKGAKTTATMVTEEFIEALERISVIAKSTDYHIVSLEFTSGQVRLASTNQEVGNAEEIMQARIEGEDVRIAFNVHYLLEALKVLDGERFTMSMSGSLGACKITDDDPGFLYAVTPMRIRE